MKRETLGCCTFQGLRQKAMYHRAQQGSPHTLGHVLGSKQAQDSLSVLYAVSHRNIICQHLNENYTSNCGATMGNCIPLKGKTTLALLIIMLIAAKPQGRLAFLLY